MYFGSLDRAPLNRGCSWNLLQSLLEFLVPFASMTTGTTVAMTPHTFFPLLALRISKVSHVTFLDVAVTWDCNVYHYCSLSALSSTTMAGYQNTSLTNFM
ncbi:hypothetical protein ILYODFUR_010147 [Ilyodon furcidens]|uniref:Uncharacterized protein n=1 Tax=Ilyodon furcidens TaxID=33524 RepID=A0ABV0SK07_9TELE